VALRKQTLIPLILARDADAISDALQSANVMAGTEDTYFNFGLGKSSFILFRLLKFRIT
jgi:hypothetical protein